MVTCFCWKRVSNKQHGAIVWIRHTHLITNNLHSLVNMDSNNLIHAQLVLFDLFHRKPNHGDPGNSTIAVYFDFPEAFDIVSHKLLLSKISWKLIVQISKFRRPQALYSSTPVTSYAGWQLFVPLYSSFSSMTILHLTRMVNNLNRLLLQRTVSIYYLKLNYLITILSSDSAKIGS